MAVDWGGPAGTDRRRPAPHDGAGAVLFPPVLAARAGGRGLHRGADRAGAGACGGVQVADRHPRASAPLVRPRRPAGGRGHRRRGSAESCQHSRCCSSRSANRAVTAASNSWALLAVAARARKSAPLGERYLSDLARSRLRGWCCRWPVCLRSRRVAQAIAPPPMPAIIAAIVSHMTIPAVPVINALSFRLARASPVRAGTTRAGPGLAARLAGRRSRCASPACLTETGRRRR